MILFILTDYFSKVKPDSPIQESPAIVLPGYQVSIAKLVGGGMHFRDVPGFSRRSCPACARAENWLSFCIPLRPCAHVGCRITCIRGHQAHGGTMPILCSLYIQTAHGRPDRAQACPLSAPMSAGHLLGFCASCYLTCFCS